MRNLIAATALGTVLVCGSPAFAQGVGFCDPQHSLKTWIESAPSGVEIHKLSKAGTEALMEVIKEPTSPLFVNTVGAALVLLEGSPVGVVAFYDDRGCIVDTIHANAADILLWIEDAVSAPAVDITELMRGAISLPCQATSVVSLRARARSLPSVEFKDTWVQYSLNWVQYSPPGITGRRLVFAVGDDELAVKFTGPIGSPDQVTVSYVAEAGTRPLLVAMADASCTIHTARRVTYDAAGRPEWLQDLDSALRPIGEPEPLNPPVPAGHDSPGIPVGLVDTGVNYLLPEIASRLARSPEGEILGYDYWDLDRRPFDASPTPDPFYPSRHGTQTASLLLDEAPVAKLVPYRYPRHEMARMTALIEDAAADGVQLMNVSLSSLDREEWLPFRATAAAHPEMLFVVAAGNHGRNLDVRPIYPAAFDLDNLIVVTSAAADGRLNDGVNWGARSVDLMVPGEDVAALDFDGERRPVSGSSYATARATALAACLLAGHPEWSTAELKAAIFREAQPNEAGDVAIGFVPDTALGNRGACDPQHLAAHRPGSQAMGKYRSS